jgi:hypothetical protein
MHLFILFFLFFLYHTSFNVSEVAINVRPEIAALLACIDFAAKLKRLKLNFTCQ